MSNIVCYKNGNYNVMIDLDNGTKIRYNNEVEFDPFRPESMDVTISKYCEMDCPFCLPAGTKILMGDYTYKNIEDVKIGDIVIGFDENNPDKRVRRRLYPTKVTQTFVHVESDIATITTEDGRTVSATTNHPFLMRRNRRETQFKKVDGLRVGDMLHTCGFPLEDINYNDEQYKIGYLVGSWVGDGSIGHYIDKFGKDAYVNRFVTKDDEINDAVYEVTKHFIDDVYRLKFDMGNNNIAMAVNSNKKSTYISLNNIINNNIGINDSKEYCCGFLAGFCDSEGHVDNQRSILRLSNTDTKYIDECKRCLSIIGIDYVVEKRDGNENNKDVYVVRVKGKFAVMRFLWYTRTVCNRKTLDNYIKLQKQYNHQQYDDVKITSIDIKQDKQYVYNFATECHTYIADGFLVHNCYAGCSKNGKEADIMTHSFIDNLPPYTELALNGNEPLHTDLIPFLGKCRNLRLIPSLTVNQYTFMKNAELLRELSNNKMLYGLGVSLTNPNEEFIETIKTFPNAVIHVVNGIVTTDQLKILANHGLKLLILGYKEFGRGVEYYGYNALNVEYEKSELYNTLPEIINDNWFDVVSFDNLAIEQLDVKRLMSEDEWGSFYMGDDGFATFYVDLVEKKFYKNSMSNIGYPITDNAIDMFNVIRSE